jgi:hypothetical protein
MQEWLGIEHRLGCSPQSALLGRLCREVDFAVAWGKGSVCTAEGCFNDCWRKQQQGEELCAVKFHDDDEMMMMMALSLQLRACCRLCLLSTPDRSFLTDQASKQPHMDWKKATESRSLVGISVILILRRK